MAIAARAATDTEAAALHARRLTLSQHADAKWAHSLLGDMARNVGDPAAAIVDYRAALAIDQNFNIVRLGLARALAETGDFAAASQALAEAEAADSRMAGLPAARADVMLIEGDQKGAITNYLLAAERNPLDPGPLTKAGALELALGNKTDGMDHLTQALALDPGYSQALQLLGHAYRTDGDLAAAERLFKNWVDYIPASPEARLALAEILIARDHKADAAPHYDALVSLLPDNLDQATARSRLYAELGQFAKAVDGLAPFTIDETATPIAVRTTAEIEQGAGWSQRALANYRRYLELAPDAPDRAEVEAAIAKLNG